MAHCVVMAAHVGAQDAVETRCASAAQIHVCIDGEDQIDPSAVAALIAFQLDARAQVDVSIRVSSARVASIGVDTAGRWSTTIVYVTGSGAGELARAVLLEIEGRRAPPAARERAVSSSPELRRDWFPRLFLATPPQGTWMLTARARGMLAVDHTGFAGSADLVAEHLPARGLVLGLAVSPYMWVGDHIPGGRAGLLATASARIDGTAGAIGLYAGTGTLARTGAPFAPIAGITGRLGPHDFLHAELNLSIGWDDEAQHVMLGDVGFELLFPAGDVVELGLWSSIAPELGWIRFEAGARIFFDGVRGRGPGHLGLEVAVGGQAMRFRASCGFEYCPFDDWASGPTLMIGIIDRVR